MTSKVSSVYLEPARPQAKCAVEQVVGETAKGEAAASVAQAFKKPTAKEVQKHLDTTKQDFARKFDAKNY